MPGAVSLSTNQAAPSSAAGTTPTRYLPFIEGMRGVAALYVVLGHIAALVDSAVIEHQPSKSPLWLQYVLGFFGYGHLAVAAFIVISGFCLWLAIHQRGDVGVKDVRGFLMRRCRRILPAYYACLAVSVLVSLTVTPRGHGMPYIQYLPVTSENVLAHVLLVHNLRPEWMYKINGVLWSIAIEFQLYFLFPLLARIWRRIGWGPLLLLTVAISVGVALLVPRGVKLYPWFLSLFFLGMVGAWYGLRPTQRGSWLWLVGAAGVAVCVAGTVAGWSPIVTECGIAVTTLALLAGGTGAELAGRRSPASVFAVKPLAIVGAFSYSLYLMHHPVLQAIAIFRPAVAQAPLREFAYLLVVGLPVVLAACYGFALLFEGHWVRKALRAVQGERLRPAPES
ncbi:MAG: acyltransferase family protein [Fimbriimonadaceae bacterium]